MKCVIDNKYVIERIEYMALYRVFEMDHPEQTCCYVDSIEEAMNVINGRRKQDK